MRKLILLFGFSLSVMISYAQGNWVVGPAGGVVISDVFFQNLRVNTTYHIQGVGGIMATFLPEKKKPGIKLIAGQMKYGFSELTENGKITYTNSGLNFQFLTHMFIPIKTFRLSIEAGPAISYFDSPLVTPDQSNSILPAFTADNINTVMLDLEGGIGLAQPIGRFHLSAHSVFAFNTAKIYKNRAWMSNPLALQVWFGIQYQIKK